MYSLHFVKNEEYTANSIKVAIDNSQMCNMNAKRMMIF